MGIEFSGWHIQSAAFIKELQFRSGSFRLNESWVMTYPEICMSVLSKVVVVRAEMMFLYKAIQYFGYSFEFDVVDRGSESPVYQVLIKPDEGEFPDRYSWMFEKEGGDLKVKGPSIRKLRI